MNSVFPYSRSHAVRQRLGSGLQREGCQEIEEKCTRLLDTISRPASEASFHRRWNRHPLPDCSPQASLQPRQCRHRLTQHRPRRHPETDLEGHPTLVSNSGIAEPVRVTNSPQDNLAVFAFGASSHSPRLVNEAYCMTASEPANTSGWLFRKLFTLNVRG